MLLTPVCVAAAKKQAGAAVLFRALKCYTDIVEIRQSHRLLSGSVSRPQRDHKCEPGNAAGFGRRETLKLSLTVLE